VSFRLVLHTPGISWLRAIFPFNSQKQPEEGHFLNAKLQVNLQTVDVGTLQLLCRVRDGVEVHLCIYLSPML
jgi:hypothetical protein